jgi:NADH:ubiquinone oxidoreductase subunit 5 (subunit L)/multisubunit Na+/H+ antiporter MnhA subunit
MTFAGQPRDSHRYDHAHESPPNMYMPLVILSVFAVAVAWSSFEAYLVGAAGLVVTGIVALVWGLQGRLSEGAGSHEETAGSHGEEHARDEEHAHDAEHAHGEHHGSLSISPRAALLVSALFFAGVLCFTVLWSQGSYYVVLQNLIGQARPPGTLAETTGVLTSLVWPDEFDSHAYKVPVTILASGTAAGGFVLALLMYGLGYLNPADVKRQFQPVYRLLLNKWWFDELYQRVFVQPTLVISGWFAWLDRNLLDGLLHLISGGCVRLANLWDRIFDRFAIDGLVNRVAGWTRSLGRSLRAVQTGELRQYVMFIVLGVVLIFLFISVFWNPVLAG